VCQVGPEYLEQSMVSFTRKRELVVRRLTAIKDVFCPVPKVLIDKFHPQRALPGALPGAPPGAPPVSSVVLSPPLSTPGCTAERTVANDRISAG
jgi:hypothetical protein